MKLFVVIILTGFFLLGNLYGFDQEAKSRLIDIYNFTRNQYIVIVGLIDELVNSRIEDGEAKEKIIQWRDFYAKKAESSPPEAEEMCGLMNEILDLTQEIARDYQPDYKRTKDMFDEFDGLKSKLINEMNELKLILQ